MAGTSLGIIETRGYVAAVVAADAGTKAAAVTFLGYEQVSPALISIAFQGDVAAVTAAVQAGVAAADPVGEIVARLVIPRPTNNLSFPSGKSLNLPVRNLPQGVTSRSNLLQRQKRQLRPRSALLQQQKKLPHLEANGQPPALPGKKQPQPDNEKRRQLKRLPRHQKKRLLKKQQQKQLRLPLQPGRNNLLLRLLNHLRRSRN